MYRALSARPSFIADLSPCRPTGCYKLILMTLYGGIAAAVRQRHLNNIHFYYYYYYYYYYSARKSKGKNCRLASLVSNPLFTVLILKLWAKWFKYDGEAHTAL